MNDKTITLYNYHKDADKTESWYRTLMKGVSVSYNSEKTVSSTGAIVYTQLLTLVIPVDVDTVGKKYIDCVHFLKAADADSYFTFNPSCNKDMIVVGESVREITKGYTISDLKKDFQQCGTVSAFSDNTFGDLLKHFKVVCK